jgi:hypothetical protein
MARSGRRRHLGGMKHTASIHPPPCARPGTTHADTVGAPSNRPADAAPPRPTGGEHTVTQHRAHPIRIRQTAKRPTRIAPAAASWSGAPPPHAAKSPAQSRHRAAKGRKPPKPPLATSPPRARTPPGAVHHRRRQWRGPARPSSIAPNRSFFLF